MRTQCERNAKIASLRTTAPRHLDEKLQKKIGPKTVWDACWRVKRWAAQGKKPSRIAFPGFRCRQRAPKTTNLKRVKSALRAAVDRGYDQPRSGTGSFATAAATAPSPRRS
jgi:hypothetical protein